MIMIPKRGYRVCLHCGHIFKKGEEKKSISMKTGTFEVCPACSCPTKKEYSGNVLTPIQASSYFGIVESVRKGELRNMDDAISLYERYNIPQKLWKLP